MRRAPLKTFKGDDFVVAAGPHRDGAAWKMTVDGVELTRD